MMVRVQTGSYVAVDRQTTYLVGSGTTAILAIARTISRKRIQFKSHVELVAFVRPPPLLFRFSFCSSDRLAKSKVFGVPTITLVSLSTLENPAEVEATVGELRDSGANVTLMIQSDMLAYHAPGEHAQLAFPET